MENNIEFIEIILEDNFSFRLTSKEFSNFYIANIDENGNEIPYERLLDTNNLYANLLLLKLNDEINNNYNFDLIKHLYKSKNIKELNIITKDKEILNFNLASTVNPFQLNDINAYDQSFIVENNLNIMITPYKFKYKKNLFV